MPSTPSIPIYATAKPPKLSRLSKETDSISNSIVLELLRDDNYENWSASMKNYLLGQELWFIIEEPIMKPTLTPDSDDFEKETYKEWRKINAQALHAIQLSCGVDILSKIREIDSAKEVWNTLATMNKPINLSDIPGNINKDLVPYEPLHTAINNGNWDAAKNFLSRHKDATSARVSVHGRTVLHVAVFAGHTEIVEELVKLMSKEELAISDEYGLTALAQAAILQNTSMVHCMLRMNTNLINIPDKENRIPLITALEYGNIEVARYLYSASLQNHQTLSDIDASTVLTRFILVNNFDVALQLLQHCPRSAIVPNMYGNSPLNALAWKSSAFSSGNQLVFWKNWIYACITIRSEPSTSEIHIDIPKPNEQQSDLVKISGSVLGLLRRLPSNLFKLLGIKQIYEMKLLNYQARKLLVQMCSQVKQMNADYVNDAIFQAIKGGVIEFIDEIVKVDHQLLYTTDTMGRNIFFYAVLYRQAKIFNLIYRLGKAKNSVTNVRDSSKSTILHMAAMLEPSTKRDRIAGDALKMQSEVQWFQEVESICNPLHSEIRNETKMTARELFNHDHKDMVKGGEEWMKGTATSCTVVGALIITIMFTAAFTVPGGNDQNTGFPMFSHKRLFTVFIICDVLSLFSSSTSVLVFLGILTSRYAEEDFLRSLPTKMIIGLSTLFFSIATMMITFYAGICIILPGKSWVTIPVICLASVTVILFGFMQFPIIFDMIKSTYGPSIFDRKKKHFS